MFIPLHDANSLRHIRAQYVTIAIIAINVAVFLLTGFNGQQALIADALGYGYVPSVVHDINELSPELVRIPEELTYISYAFLHADIMHLAGNMLFLWVFGDNVEDALGHIKYVIFYLACAAAGAWLHGFMDPASETPLIGASGAVAGIVAAYLLLHPRVKVWVLALGRIPLRIPAFIPLLLWIGLQVFMFLASGEDEVSWAAHLGGIAAGALLLLVLRRPGVPLFDRAIVTPRAVVTEPPPLPEDKPDRGGMGRRWGRQ